MQTKMARQERLDRRKGSIVEKEREAEQSEESPNVDNVISSSQSP